MHGNRIYIRNLNEGDASGKILVLQKSLSFWGGVNPETGFIIDRHHPQCGQSIKETLLLMPGIKGSTAGPGALLECLYANNGPAAIILLQPEVSCIIAANVYLSISGKKLPIIEIEEKDAINLHTGEQWMLTKGELVMCG